MRTSSEKHLVEQLQLVLTLCGKVSSSCTMLHQDFGTMPLCLVTFSPLSLRRSSVAGSKVAGRAGSGDCRRLRGIRIAREAADSTSLRHPAWRVRAGPLVLANAAA